jgi:predicted metal-dependent phosphoesterase TrpH
MSMATRGAQGRADLHIHTCHSDGIASVRETLEYASMHTRLDVIAITDHDTIEGALEAAALAHMYRVEVVVGEEITSREGHILGLFLTSRVPPRLSAMETVAAIHEQGGLAIAAHPFLHAVSHFPDGFQARMGAGAAIRRVPFDALEVNDAFPGLALANLRLRRANARYCRLPLVGNSDSHVKEAIGRSFTRFPGHTALDLKAAILDGQVTPGWRPYGAAQLRAYFSFWRGARRVRPREGEPQ